jgi:hypothetical protein
MRSLTRVSLLVVVLAVTAAHACRGDVADQCLAKCREIADAPEPSAVKAKNNAAFKTCAPWNASGAAVARICITQFLKFGQHACMAGCSDRMPLNTYLGQPRTASKRKDCNVYKTQRPFPTLQNSCLAGFKSGIEYFLEKGKTIRESMEECETPEALAAKENEAVVDTTKPIENQTKKNSTANTATAPVKELAPAKTDAKPDTQPEPQTPKLRARQPAAADVIEETVFSGPEVPVPEVAPLLEQGSV